MQYRSADGTATSKIQEFDYWPVSGTLKFASRQTSHTIKVPIIGDTRKEVNETFSIKLMNPTNAIIVDGLGQATIFDDE